MSQPGPRNQGNPKVADLGEQLYNGISEVTQQALCFAKRQYDINVGDAAYVSSMGALGAINLACLSFAKRPDMTAEEAIEKGEETLVALITPETTQFTCLVISLMTTDFNARGGKFTTEFGPPIFWEALKMWELLNPGKDADKYFDKGMLKAARDVGEGSVIPFDEFLAKRAQQSPSSSTLN